MRIVMASAFGAVNKLALKMMHDAFGREDWPIFPFPCRRRSYYFNTALLVLVNLSDKFQGGSADRSSIPAQLLHSKKCLKSPVQAHFGPWLTFAGAANHSHIVRIP